MYIGDTFNFLVSKSFLTVEERPHPPSVRDKNVMDLAQLLKEEGLEISPSCSLYHFSSSSPVASAQLISIPVLALVYPFREVDVKGFRLCDASVPDSQIKIVAQDYDNSPVRNTGPNQPMGMGGYVHAGIKGHVELDTRLRGGDLLKTSELLKKVMSAVAHVYNPSPLSDIIKGS